MSYTTRYQIPWVSRTNSGYVYIDYDVSYSAYGTGVDGDVTISSSTYLTSNKNYNNLTVNAPLYTNGYQVYVKGCLNISPTGGVLADGFPGGNQSSGTGGTGGAGAYSTAKTYELPYFITGYNYSPGIPKNGGAGASGIGNGTLNGAGSSSISPFTNSGLLLVGDGGGGGGSHGSGAATGCNGNFTIYGRKGGAGGAAIGTTSCNIGGAGGGGGAGILYLEAYNVSNGGRITARGGNGGASSRLSDVSSGAGGGGGGGTVIFIYEVSSGLGIGVIDASGGIRGNQGYYTSETGTYGSSYNPSNGTDGSTYKYNYVRGQYASNPENLMLAKDGIRITNTLNSWEEPVFTQTAEVTIQNDATTTSRFFEMLDLMIAEERKYKIRINQTSPDTKKLFEGYLNTDIVEQGYLAKQPIRLIASNYIKKTENIEPEIVKNSSINSCYDYIAKSLLLTGTDSSISVNMDIYSFENSIGVTKTALNTVSVLTEAFHKNDVEYDNGYEVINKILKPFDSYIYWWNGDWYIERYNDLDNYPQHYVKYNINNSYNNYDEGINTSTGDVPINIWSYKHKDKNQLISIIPGIKTIELKLNFKGVGDYNLIDPTFTLFNNVGETNTLPYNMNPETRKINYFGNYYNGDFDRFFTFNTAGYTPYGIYGPIKNAIRRDNYPVDQTKHSIALGFKTTVEPSSGQTLNIKWKYMPVSVSNPRAYDYRFGWYLKTDTSIFIIKDISANNDHWYQYSTINPSIYTQYIDFSCSNVKKDIGLLNAEVNIPIGDPSISFFWGDHKLVFGLLEEYLSLAGNNSYSIVPSKVYYGDFEVTVSGYSLQNNLITASQNTKFLNKHTTELDLFDTISLNYSNGFLNHNLERTVTWLDNSGTYDLLINKIITNKFKLYNKSRQQISSIIDCSSFLKPLSVWYDSNQPTKKFILTSYDYIPTKNEYKCIWSEYDNSEIININE